MATGRSNQLIKQMGEYLVACELARRGLVVATFSGNVPDFDLIATDFKGASRKPESKSESKPDAKADAKADSKSDAKPEAKPETKSESKAAA